MIAGVRCWWVLCTPNHSGLHPILSPFKLLKFNQWMTLCACGKFVMSLSQFWNIRIVENFDVSLRHGPFRSIPLILLPHSRQSFSSVHRWEDCPFWEQRRLPYDRIGRALTFDISGSIPIRAANGVMVFSKRMPVTRHHSTLVGLSPEVLGRLEAQNQG
ncbi:conserved hypothetical protein [Coccidioides posadasii str. Silveira]|uniref:Uncharacterized protein n=1 Tax=Coccidioides posadasii (strain RMSCC 757 / Silveira) TaxID=443226 RepID=E9D1M2_COCPS|nr:conserved hypothetical protein [Coccidioides posadasii str. Silveira]